MEAKTKKLDRYVTVTATLYKEIEELSVLENGLRKALQCGELEGTTKEQKVLDLQQKIFWQRQEVKYLKDRSLWNRSFDTAVLILAKSIFTILARIKLVFGIAHGYPTSLPRCLSASATVHPTENPTTCNFVSGPLKISKLEGNKDFSTGFFETNSKLLSPPATTLGAAALALHYANLIIILEKMIKSPQLVGIDARDDLYAMLPNSILGWLSPLAHNMIKWQSERSFEQQNLVPKTNVFLLQTLFFANKEKTEAAITELLVGLNYIWRFEREMTAKALFECANFNGFLNPQNSS
ncbi:protein PSK SIMULATOR 3-like [Populus alba x Populus x berolinensis]|nr:protein PSK SIMULATOR 3-like [Populus alba x Populus x berolinensis]